MIPAIYRHDPIPGVPTDPAHRLTLSLLFDPSEDPCALEMVWRREVWMMLEPGPVEIVHELWMGERWST